MPSQRKVHQEDRSRTRQPETRSIAPADSSSDTGSSGSRELPLANEPLKFTHYSELKIG